MTSKSEALQALYNLDPDAILYDSSILVAPHGMIWSEPREHCIEVEVDFFQRENVQFWSDAIKKVTSLGIPEKCSPDNCNYWDENTNTCGFWRRMTKQTPPAP